MRRAKIGNTMRGDRDLDDPVLGQTDRVGRHEVLVTCHELIENRAVRRLVWDTVDEELERDSILQNITNLIRGRSVDEESEMGTYGGEGDVDREDIRVIEVGGARCSRVDEGREVALEEQIGADDERGRRVRNLRAGVAEDSGVDPVGEGDGTVWVEARVAGV
jgi:hypothetical protein